MMIEKLQKIIQDALGVLELPEVEFVVEHPADEVNGDYSSNIALSLFSQNKESGIKNQDFKNPRELAEKIAEAIRNLKLETRNSIDKVEIAGPGFINFFLTEEYLLSEMSKVLSGGSEYGSNENLKDKKIVVEYTDPNPFKEFHVGHLYSNAVGESIARILEAHGAKVWRADFFGDVGMHAAKSVWGLIQKLEEDKISFDDLSEWDLGKRIEYFGQSYAKGSTAYRDDEAVAEEIKQLNFLIFKIAQEEILPTFGKEKEVDYDQFIKPSKFDYDEIKSVYIQGRQWSLDYFETIYARVGTKFDGYYPESLTGEYGYNMILDGLKKDVFEKGDKGAIVFPGEKHGLHTRVFINSMGLPTYEAKDFGLLHAKYHDFKYDESVIVTGNEINEYFHVVLKAMREYEFDLGDITTHIGHGMVRLPEGKMSSRTGKIIRGAWVLDEAKKRVLEVLSESTTVTKEERDGVAEKIAIGAVKYALLKHGVGSDIAFDFETSLSFDGNSGPYIQYAAVRCKSVLLRSKMTNFQLPNINEFSMNNEEASVLKWLYRYPEVIGEAAQKYAPHVVATYLHELASRFNTFYNKHSVLNPGDESIPGSAAGATRSQDLESVKQFRLSLTSAVAQVIENGLDVLGIPVPSKM